MAEEEALLATLREQEERLQFTQFTNETALAIGMALLHAAQQDHLGITIDVTRHGHQLFHVALPGTSPDNDLWIQRKNRVVNHFGHSSFYVGTVTRGKGMTLQERSGLDPVLYADHGGAFPIIIQHVGVVGTITVSGLAQADDHALVVRVVEQFLAQAV
ncbi:MAG: heme-degrading domain-containing protein [Ktedonobacterales bacterium]|nr:heme-degrading domain-containing protein [Ktedonobacterales bacterium]